MNRKNESCAHYLVVNKIQLVKAMNFILPLSLGTDRAAGLQVQAVWTKNRIGSIFARNTIESLSNGIHCQIATGTSVYYRR